MKAYLHMSICTHYRIKLIAYLVIMEEWKLNVATDMDDVHVVDDVSICEPALYVIENDSTTQMNK